MTARTIGRPATAPGSAGPPGNLDVSAGYDARIARRATGLLRSFNAAGILTAADVHVATRLGALTGERDEAVLLAVALTVRSTRHGSVMLDLGTVRETVSPDDEVDLPPGIGIEQPAAELPWPGPEWAARCASSPLAGGPIRVAGGRLWLARYWDQEEQVAAELLARCADPPADLDPELLASGLRRVFPDPADADQRYAAASCALARVSVLAGGPGTGKTTTVARLLALLVEQMPRCRIALAAPTGKAAARLEEAVRWSTAQLPEQDRLRLGELPAVTLHRLLGWRPGARSRFRHDRGNRLPFEVVVVDESSMVSLTLMARLLEALRPVTRLVLVGDPDQLASVEAGAVLADLVDAGSVGHRTPDRAADLERVLPGISVRRYPGPAPEGHPGGRPEGAGSRAARLRDGVSALTTVHRFAPDSAIAGLAGAVRAGSGNAALAILRTGGDELEFVEVDDAAGIPDGLLAGLRADVEQVGILLRAAAEDGDAAGALHALELHRLLCAHRTGPRGVQRWGDLAAGWIDERQPVPARSDGRYPGEPLLVTGNDYDVGLYNGDTGVVIRASAGSATDGDPETADLVAVFGRGGPPIRVPLGRLAEVRPLQAMTVHRSQGSQFDRITVLLPAADSPLATRQTVYTAVTRARHHVRLIGSAEALLAAVARPAARATGLRERLDGVGEGPE